MQGAKNRVLEQKLTVTAESAILIAVLLPASVKAGEFTVEVRTKYNGVNARPLKELKAGRYKKTVTAIAAV